MRLYVLLQLAGALVVHCLWLVVNLTVPEYLHYVLAKLLTVSILAVAELFLQSLEVDGLLDDQVVVRDVLEGHRLSERP